MFSDGSSRSQSLHRGGVWVDAGIWGWGADWQSVGVSGVFGASLSHLEGDGAQNFGVDSWAGWLVAVFVGDVAHFHVSAFRADVSIVSLDWGHGGSWESNLTLLPTAGTVGGLVTEVVRTIRVQVIVLSEDGHKLALVGAWVDGSGAKWTDRGRNLS